MVSAEVLLKHIPAELARKGLTLTSSIVYADLQSDEDRVSLGRHLLLNYLVQHQFLVQRRRGDLLLVRLAEPGRARRLRPQLAKLVGRSHGPDPTGAN